MSKAVSYKANSIIYFKGDMNEQVYLLKSGMVDLRYNDIETGAEMHDSIQSGEFFSVKSSLGKYPKEETAVVLRDAEIIVFSVSEFEQVTMKNTRIILKMLRVFSNQLRRIHRQVRNLLSSGESISSEKGLFHIGEYYKNRRQYPQALYAFRRYLTYYPSGDYASRCSSNIQEIETQASQGDNAPPPSMGREENSQGRGPSDVDRRYNNAVGLFDKKRYSEALEEFKAISKEGTDRKYLAKTSFEIGRCLFSLDNFDACIQHFIEMVQKYPKHPKLLDILFYVGSSHASSGDQTKAKGFFNKILTTSEKDSPIFKKAQEALKEVGGT